MYIYISKKEGDQVQQALEGVASSIINYLQPFLFIFRHIRIINQYRNLEYINSLLFRNVFWKIPGERSWTSNSQTRLKVCSLAKKLLLLKNFCKASYCSPLLIGKGSEDYQGRTSFIVNQECKFQLKINYHVDPFETFKKIFQRMKRILDSAFS